jgi:hypothetical protein
MPNEDLFQRKGHSTLLQNSGLKGIRTTLTHNHPTAPDLLVTLENMTIKNQLLFKMLEERLLLDIKLNAVETTVLEAALDLVEEINQQPGYGHDHDTAVACAREFLFEEMHGGVWMMERSDTSGELEVLSDLEAEVVEVPEDRNIEAGLGEGEAEAEEDQSTFSSIREKIQQKNLQACRLKGVHRFLRVVVHRAEKKMDTYEAKAEYQGLIRRAGRVEVGEDEDDQRVALGPGDRFGAISVEGLNRIGWAIFANTRNEMKLYLDEATLEANRMNDNQNHSMQDDSEDDSNGLEEAGDVEGESDVGMEEDVV